MIYRLGAGLIVIFWAVMWGLLINAELSPQAALVRRVPVELILKQAFMHRQASHLFIYQGPERLGHLRVAPQVDDATGQRKLELFGNFQISWPGIPPQRVIWEAMLELDGSLQLTAARGTVNLRMLNARNAGTTKLEWMVDPHTQRGHYKILADEVVVEDEALTLTQEGLSEHLRKWGADTSWLAAWHGQTAPATTELVARQSQVNIKGQEIEAYAVSLHYNGQTLLEAKVSELGQVLEASTLVGWTLRTD